MHKPGNKKTTLDWICENIVAIKDELNPRFSIGYSFIIVWKDCEANDAKIHENIDEIVMAAERAKRYKFDYISYKPFLTRAESNNAEIVEITQQQNRVDPIMTKIREQVEIAKWLDDESFRVVESTNLRVLENDSYKDYNHANWFIEGLIENPEKLEQLQPAEDRQDYFL
jgi:hypothetical protein